MKELAASDAIINVQCNRDNRSGVGSNKYRITFGPNQEHGKNVARIVPTHAMIPNLFPNVRAPYNTYLIGATTVTIAEGFYTGAELAAALNTATTAAGFPGLVWVFEQVPGTSLMTRFTLTQNAAGPTLVTVNYTNIGKILGELEWPGFSLVDFTISMSITDVAIWNFPDLGGEKIVHVKSEKLGHQHGSMSVSDHTEDLVLTIPLHNVIYGEMAHWAANDTKMGGIDCNFDVDLHTVDVSLWDSLNEPLILPETFTVELQFKVIHGPGVV